MTDRTETRWDVGCRDALGRQRTLRVWSGPGRVVLVTPPAESSTLTIQEAVELRAALLRACEEAERLTTDLAGSERPVFNGR